MSQIQCGYCGGQEGRSSAVCSGGGGHSRFITECRGCARIVDERRADTQELLVERATDSPLCIVTPDFTDNPDLKIPPLDDDPFESSGFITAFSTFSLELTPLFTTTTATLSGHLAELERVMAEYYPNGGASLAASLNLVDMLRAYFQIVEVSSVLGLERDSSEHAVQLFRDCSTTTYLRNRNIEALATAALVQASREAQEPRTLQEISAAANIPQKEIARHMKVLSDALKLSQPINSNSISVHMPRFCNLLQLNKTTQDLASHIGEVVISKSFCTRRNPISISAAAIYLACQLEDKRKTQTEICKATGLTEVTLRKVYKELLENLDDLMPKGYTPAVPPEKAFPVTTGLRVTLTNRPAQQLGPPPSIILESPAAAAANQHHHQQQHHLAPDSATFRMPSTSIHHQQQQQQRPPFLRPPGNVYMMPPVISSSVTPIPFLASSSGGEDAKGKERVGLRCDKSDVDLNSGPAEEKQQKTSLGQTRRASLHDLNMVPTMEEDEVVEVDLFQRKMPGPDLNAQAPETTTMATQVEVQQQQQRAGLSFHGLWGMPQPLGLFPPSHQHQQQQQSQSFKQQQDKSPAPSPWLTNPFFITPKDEHRN